jgi:hypothetical protein
VNCVECVSGQSFLCLLSCQLVLFLLLCLLFSCLLSCRVVSCCVVSRLALSCRVVSCLVVSCLALSCRVLSCLVSFLSRLFLVSSLSFLFSGLVYVLFSCLFVDTNGHSTTHLSLSFVIFGFFFVKLFEVLEPHWHEFEEKVRSQASPNLNP